MIKAWLRQWLGIDAQSDAIGLLDKTIHDLDEHNTGRIDFLSSELARLEIANYVPPVTPEPERKIIKTRNFKEYLDILEQEQSREHSDAV